MQGQCTGHLPMDKKNCCAPGAMIDGVGQCGSWAAGQLGSWAGAIDLLGMICLEVLPTLSMMCS